MYSNNKLIRDVADIAAQIMSGKQPVTEKLHPNQQQLDVHEPEKDELTSDDFKKLRAKKEVKKEEVETVEEAAGKLGSKAPQAKVSQHSTLKPVSNPKTGLSGQVPASKEVKREELEQEEPILEYESKDGKFVHNAKTGRYGGSEKPTDPFAGVRGPSQKDLEKIEAEKKKKQKKFSEMVNLYQDKGLKSLSEMLAKEEVTEDEFNKEVEDAKDKAAGKKKQPEIAKGSVQAVKNEETHSTVEVIDLNDVNGVQYSEIELAQERTLTAAETEKKEEIVKSMKKGLSGFKDRYGDRAKEVMYATATKNAKGE
jgi:hypothetical protein